MATAPARPRPLCRMANSHWSIHGISLALIILAPASFLPSLPPLLPPPQHPWHLQSHTRKFLKFNDKVSRVCENPLLRHPEEDRSDWIDPVISRVKLLGRRGRRRRRLLAATKNPQEDSSIILKNLRWNDLIPGNPSWIPFLDPFPPPPP